MPPDGAVINLHWLELPLSRTNFHGPKGVRAIEVRLYFHRTPVIISIYFISYSLAICNTDSFAISNSTT